MTTFADIATGLRLARERMEAATRTFSERRAALLADPNLSEEGKAGQLEKLRTAHTEALEALRSSIELHTELSTSALGRARRETQVDPDAADRVRSLLRSGVAAGAVAERARETGDRAMLAALRAEVPYLEISGRLTDHDATEGLLTTLDADLHPEVTGVREELDLAQAGLRYSHAADRGEAAGLETLVFAYATGEGE